MTEKILSYDHTITPQETGYWCGPASTQVVLNGRGILASEADLAREIGTTVNGTDYVGLIEPVLRRRLPKANYASVYLPNDPPTEAQKSKLWWDIVRSIDNGYGVVMNWVAPPSNYPRGVKGSISPAYSFGTVFHYVACMGWSDEGNNGRPALWIADSGFRPFGYWIDFEQVATLIPPKGYCFANLPLIAPPAPGVSVPPGIPHPDGTTPPAPVVTVPPAPEPAPEPAREKHLAVVFRGTGGIIGQDYVSRVCQAVGDLVEEQNPEWAATMGGLPVGTAGSLSDPSMWNAVQAAFLAGQRMIMDALAVNPRRGIVIGGYSAGAIVAALLRQWLLDTHPENYVCSFSIGDPTRPEGGGYYPGVATPAMASVRGSSATSTTGGTAGWPSPATSTPLSLRRAPPRARSWRTPSTASPMSRCPTSSAPPRRCRTPCWTAWRTPASASPS